MRYMESFPFLLVILINELRPFHKSLARWISGV